MEPIYRPKQSERFPLPTKSIIKLPSGKLKPVPKIQYGFEQGSAAAKADREGKLNIINGVLERSWDGYREQQHSRSIRSCVTSIYGATRLASLSIVLRVRPNALRRMVGRTHPTSRMNIRTQPDAQIGKPKKGGTDHFYDATQREHFCLRQRRTGVNPQSIFDLPIPNAAEPAKQNQVQTSPPAHTPYSEGFDA